MIESEVYMFIGYGLVAGFVISSLPMILAIVISAAVNWLRG